MIQLTSGLADHSHSRLIPMPTLPVPPLLATTGCVPVTVSAQRVVDGAATLEVDEELHAAAASAHHSSTHTDDAWRTRTIKSSVTSKATEGKKCVRSR